MVETSHTREYVSVGHYYGSMDRLVSRYIPNVTGLTSEDAVCFGGLFVFKLDQNCTSCDKWGFLNLDCLRNQIRPGKKGIGGQLKFTQGPNYLLVNLEMALALSIKCPLSAYMSFFS